MQVNDRRVTRRDVPRPQFPAALVAEQIRVHESITWTGPTRRSKRMRDVCRPAIPRPMSAVSAVQAMKSTAASLHLNLVRHCLDTSETQSRSRPPGPALSGLRQDENVSNRVHWVSLHI